MIVPRAFSAHSRDMSEKSERRSRSPRLQLDRRTKSPLTNSKPVQSGLKLPSEARSDPVKIPQRNDGSGPQLTTRPLPVPVQNNALMAAKDIKGWRRESVQDMLAATAIPSRKRVRGRPSQRLPKGDYVADFSRLLMDDVNSTNESNISRSNSHAQLDGLFGNIDELVDGQMIVGSGSVDESILTIRSPASDSETSMASPDDYSITELASQQSLVGMSRSFSERRSRQVASSEDCGGSHPLLPADDEEPAALEPSLSPPLRAMSVSPGSNGKKPGSGSGSFKSSLSASLKAIKSAAQSVSARTSLFSSPDSHRLPRSFFEVQPFLTDDRRPPPNVNPPSPELRRYLNPYTSIAPPDSPAQLHFWQDDGQSFSPKQQKKKRSKSRKKVIPNGSVPGQLIDDLPPVVQLATCLPPSVRTANASSPPIWLAPDGTPSNKQTALPLLYDPAAAAENATVIPRMREPRENCDFLRVFVCEMQMRRSGKLSEDLNTGRAKLWLPPVGDTFNKRRSGFVDLGIDGTSAGKAKNAHERWQAWSADDI